MFAIGNDELETLPVIGKTVKCDKCGGRHKVKYGTVDGKESKLLGFYDCGENTYLASVAGKSVTPSK